MDDEQNAPQAEKLYRVVHVRVEGSRKIAMGGRTLKEAENIRDKLLSVRIIGKLFIEAE